MHVFTDSDVVLHAMEQRGGGYACTTHLPMTSNMTENIISRNCHRNTDYIHECLHFEVQTHPQLSTSDDDCATTNKSFARPLRPCLWATKVQETNSATEPSFVHRSFQRWSNWPEGKARLVGHTTHYVRISGKSLKAGLAS